MDKNERDNERDNSLELLIKQYGNPEQTGKHPGGRPTKYKPEYCNEIVEFMADGGHLYEFCSHIGIARETLNLWSKEYPEFMAAKKIAKTKSVAAWMKQARMKAFGISEKGSDALMIWTLKCTAKDDLSEGNDATQDVDERQQNILSRVSNKVLDLLLEEVSHKQ